MRGKSGTTAKSARWSSKAKIGLVVLAVGAACLTDGIGWGTATAKGSDGRKIVRVATKYKDAKYVWGEESPRTGFDCSGFTWYVVKKAIGQDIGRVEDEQKTNGKKVKHGEWKAGDLVFFKKTIPGDRGVSHVGIYVGKGKFIHAENEATDVVVSDINSDYYREHYAGARRL